MWVNCVDDCEGCLRDSAGVYNWVKVTFFRVGHLKKKLFEARDLVLDLVRDLEVEPVVVVEVDWRSCGFGMMSNRGQAGAAWPGLEHSWQ